MRVMRQALWERGYILVIVGGETTGFVQLNDTHLHRVLQIMYRKKESAVMQRKTKNW